MAQGFKALGLRILGFRVLGLGLAARNLRILKICREV